MDGVACIICGGKLKVTVEGGEFFVREGSTLDNLNFEKIKKIDFEKAEELDADVMLQVKVECVADPEHMLFGFACGEIRKEIYKRIEFGARRIRSTL
jgi:hypothetical protein